MSVYRVIDRLESTLKEGVWLPFGARIVNQERLLDLMEKLRSSLPEEVTRAKAVTKDKERLLQQAKEEAGKIVEEASTTKSQLLSDSEVLRQAQARADQLMADAQERAEEVRRGADEYADRILATLDASLGNALGAVHKGRQALAEKTSLNGNPPKKERLV